MSLKDGYFPQEVREKALDFSSGYCQHDKDCVERVTEFHHMLPNTTVNRRLYPAFLKSIFNCCPIAHGCHMNKTVPTISDRQAETFEWYLSTYFPAQLEELL